VNKHLSIIVPTYNHEKYIARCIRSLINQNYQRSFYEIIVIDDGSTDNTIKILENFKDQITLIKNKKNLGLAATLNKAIKSCRSPYLVRVDSDDYVNENFIFFLRYFLEFNNELDAVACDYYLVDEKENIIERCNSNEKPIACGIIFRLDQLVKIGLYDKRFRLFEDRDLRKRFLKKFNIFRIPLPLYRYRRHEKNITNNKKNIKKYKKLLSKKKYN
jgi:glycosyltransferase involved in cell wall biosynthesis